ncbi:MAG TPA: MFS transporter [Vicinamibacterales bacterium]|jgi:MFS family permease|nr:MFS transporter [Vicinamibacterales bacterium]
MVHAQMPRRMLLRIAAAELLGMTLWFSATAAAPAVAHEFSMSEGTRAWLTMAVQAGFVAGTLLTAATNVADAINPRLLFAWGCIAGAVLNLAIVAAPSSGAIVALRFCTGAALAWIYPPGMKIAAGWFRERRGTALGVVVGAVGIGSAIPHLLVWIGAGLPWRPLVSASSLLALGGAAIVAFTVEDGPYITASAPFDRHALRVVLANRGTRLAMLGYFGHMWELYAMWTWIAAFAAASLGASAGAVGSLVAFIAIATGSIGCVLAGRWADQWGKARIAGLSMVASAVCCVVSPVVFGAGIAALTVLTVVWGFTIVADSAQFSALVTEHTARTHVGTALTLQTSAGFLLTMVSMRLAPEIALSEGWKWAFLFLAPGPLLGAVAMRALSRNSRLPTELSVQESAV